MTERIAPVAVWDATDEAWFRGAFLARAAWLKDNGLPAHKMYRAEFYHQPGDVPVARIYCYALDDGGRRHWTDSHQAGPHDHDQCDAAREEPQVIRLDALPPQELL